MAECSSKSLRRYKRLPVFIEEDHNDVVPHIHRAIASRHLPMSGIPMVHFDSHPDLLLPLHMQADDVFDKEKLYSGLSIENWILPLMYAGHINEVYWLKPPWADQLQDVVNFTFCVGKWTETGEIRITLDDPYFLTEALFAPESELTNTKRVTLHVITIKPSDWGSEVNSITSCNHNNSSENKLVFPTEADQHSLDSAQTQGSITSGSTQANTESPGHFPVEDGDSSKHSSAENMEDKDLDTSQGPSQTKLRKVEDRSDGRNEKHIESSGQIYSTEKTDQTKSADDVVDCPQETRSEKVETKTMHDSSESPSLLNADWLVALRDALEGQPFILDVDLDFFSVKDPFRQDCSTELSTLLHELFQFKLPDDKSEESVMAFSRARQAQLDELEAVFQELQHQPDISPDIQVPHRQKLVDKLVTLLSSDKSSDPPVDFEMLYRAGCTFDGTALPHHVSSPRQIQQLMSTSMCVLKCLPAPTLVTMARSSIDDYCPQDQVESIQEDMLQVLNNIYKDLDVNKAYEDQ